MANTSIQKTLQFHWIIFIGGDPGRKSLDARMQKTGLKPSLDRS